MELYIIHFVFISACVGCSWYTGMKYGRGQMLEDLMDYELFTLKDLKDKVLNK